MDIRAEYIYNKMINIFGFFPNIKLTYIEALYLYGKKITGEELDIISRLLHWKNCKQKQCCKCFKSKLCIEHLKYCNSDSCYICCNIYSCNDLHKLVTLYIRYYNDKNQLLSC